MVLALGNNILLWNLQINTHKTHAKQREYSVALLAAAAVVAANSAAVIRARLPEIDPRDSHNNQK
jgi:hypothetical protein